MGIICSLTILGSACVFSDTTTPSGSGNFAVSITNNDQNTGHNYVAYQVFTGDLVEATAGTGANLTLSNINWGSGVIGSDIVTELAGITDDKNPLKGKFTSSMSAADVAKVLSGKDDDSAFAQAFAEVVQNHLTSKSGTGSATGVTGLNAGYYFIQDEGTLADDAHPGAKTRYILQVVHSVSITQKASVPQIDKKVKDKNDTTGDETGWRNTADYDIGDLVPFQITGTLPSNFAEYDYFKTYTMTDTLSEGLTAPTSADAFTIKVGETDVKSHFDISTSGQKITVSLKSDEDLKTWDNPSLTKDSKFVVEYSAVLNDNAKSGTTGNPNEVTLTFSNNPNADGKGDYDTTPPSTVIVFTYDLNVNKVDEQLQPLSGAHFALYKQYKTDGGLPSGKTAVTSVKYNNDRSTYTFTGQYWALVEEIVTGTTFSFKGLDVGNYVLIETTTPTGYNSVEPYAFEVTATLNDEGKTVTAINGKANGETVDLGNLKATVKLESQEGSLNTQVVNNKGGVLPSTGGSGTTMIYIIGVILLAGAGILLVTRRRMKAE